MLTALRHRLQRIRYYSGRRNRDGWSVATDVAFWTALLLALPVTLLTSFMVSGTVTVDRHEGVLLRNDKAEDAVVGEVMALDAIDRPFAQSKLHGTFTLTQTEARRGWPIHIQVDRGMHLTLDVFDERGPRRRAWLADDDPIRVAIEDALVRSGHETVLETWRSGAARHRQWLVGWAVSAVIWWVMLTFVLVTAVRLASFAWKVRTAKRAAHRRARLREGVCPECGYDLQGLEFNERCPECGMLT